MKIEDRLAIHELLARYSFAFDSGDGEATADCYTEDGIFEGPRQNCYGRAELVDYVIQRSRDETQRRFVGPIVIDEVPGDPNSVRARAYLMYYEIEPSGPVPKLSAVYYDHLVRIDGQWKFKHRKVAMDVSRKGAMLNPIVRREA